MKKILLIMTAILINTLIFNISRADDYNDYFTKIYNKVKESDHDTAIERMGKQTGLSDSTIEDILDGTADMDDVRGICEKIDRSEIYQCINELNELYGFERSVAKIENLEKELAYATEIWSNGTRADSEFDLIVDLNIIDTIYFGKEAVIPNARMYDPFSDNNGDDDDMDINPGGDAGGDITNEIDDIENTPPTIVDDEDSQTIIVCDEDGNCTEVNQMPLCADPDLIIFDDDSQNIADNSDQNNNEGRSQWYRKQDWTGWSYNYQGGTYPDTYTVNSSGDSCGGEEVSMFGNMFCVEEFCNDFICIDVDFISGSPLRNVSKTNCVQCLVNYTSKELEEAYRKKESLNPSKNTPVIWDIRNWFLGDFHINIFVEQKAPPSGDRKTRDQDYTVAQEIRFIQEESYPIGGSYIHNEGSTDELMKNRDMLDMLLSADCQNYLNRIPSGALRAGAEYSEGDLNQQCEESIKKLKSPLAQANQELIQKFKQTALESRKTEVKKHYWEEILQLITEFAGKAEAIDNAFMEFPNAQQINTKKLDCKST